jgi:hypothetical protein
MTGVDDDENESVVDELLKIKDTADVVDAIGETDEVVMIFVED